MQLAPETPKPTSTRRREREATACRDSLTSYQEAWALRELGMSISRVRGRPTVDRSTTRVHGVGRWQSGDRHELPPSRTEQQRALKHG
jgi:hypothetical protein